MSMNLKQCLGWLLMFACLWCVGLGCALPVHARHAGTGAPATSAAVVAADGQRVIGHSTSHLEDASRSLDIDAVRSAAQRERFVLLEGAHPKFGYSASAHWLRFTVDPGPGALDLLLEVGLPSLDSLDPYSPEGAGHSVQHGGDRVPWSARHRAPQSCVCPARHRGRAAGIFSAR